MSKLTDHSVFTKQFREELIKDLALSESILCPKCNLNYVDNWNEGMCRYECEESDSSEEEEEEESKIPRKYEIVCVFDFYNTPLKEVIDEWLRKLLRMCGDDEELKNKWQQKINEAIN
jgi:predicted amidophosphoribosyltransferase